ncbi:MAG: HDIG domain-containing protein [Bacteroidetes bacterium]|nr:MAG: HDIG domain-containing protein [Bacteroidota bacterium]
MSFLSKIGLRKRSVRPVGSNLEKGDASTRRSFRIKIAIKASILLTLVVASMFSFRRGSDFEYAVAVDDVWRWEDLIAPYDFPILKTDSEIQADKESIRASTLPIFNVPADVTVAFQQRLDSLSSEIEMALSLWTSSEIGRSRGRLVQAKSDSIAYREAREIVALTLTEVQWRDLLESYANSTPGYSSSSRTRSSATLNQQITTLVWNTGTALLRRGVLNISKDSLYASRIMSRNLAARSQTPEVVSNLISINTAMSSARLRFDGNFPVDPGRSDIAMAMFAHSLVPSHLYDRAATEDLWNSQERALSPTKNVVRTSEIIARKGDIVTEAILQRLISLEGEQKRRNQSAISWSRFFGQLILTVSTYLIFFLFLYLLRRDIFMDNKMMVLITILFLAIMGSFAFALRYALLDMYVVPVAIVAILLTVIFDSRVGIFATLTMALMGSHLLDYDFAYMYATLFACTVGIFSVRDIRNRGQFFISAGLVLTGYLAILAATYLLQNKPLDRLTYEMMFVAFNSALLLMAYPLLWGFERVFNITTDLTLLELSDTNSPLLKEMSMNAPGTFNHVLQVANLAEAAAASIGANALLARVGALYHDIGKSGKSEYFVENQAGMDNPHDHLRPSMSALIIANHVKEGLEVARKNRIPQAVQDFIPMHHGTTRIEYFYQRALAQHQPKEPEVQESEFRYPGPKPNTAETAILMLADAVEAAARALDKPSHKRLESLVGSILQAKMDDGQLDECSLTFANLKKIKATFLTVLMGVYHVRVKYPGDVDQERTDDTDGKNNGKSRAGKSNTSGGDLLTEALN